MVARLNGAFIATGDVGATTEDVLVMYQHTRFITGLPRAMGGSGNPGAVTVCYVILLLVRDVPLVRR